MGKQKTSYRWVILFAMVFGTAMLNFSNLIFASRPTDVMAQFNMTQAQLTAISTVGQLPGAFFSIWLGNLMDKKGIRQIPTILLALAAACQIWRVFAGSFIELFIITFLAGTFFLPTQVMPAKIIGSWFDPSEMGLAMGIFGAAAGLGTTLAFALGGIFPTTKAAFAVIAVGYVIMFLLWMFFVKFPAANPEAGPGPAEMPKGDIKAVFRSKTMWLVTLCGGLAVGAALLLNSYLVLAFIAKGMDPVTAGNAATLLNVCLLIGGILSGIVVTKVGLYNIPYMVICFGGAAIYYVTYCILPLSNATFVLIAVGGIIVSGSIGVNMTKLPLIPLTGDFGMESVGTAGGLLNTAMGLFGFILPTIVASVFGDNYKGIFTLMAVFLVIIGLIGGLVIPELGENGKLAKKARGEL